jgi:guanylate kinase
VKKKQVMGRVLVVSAPSGCGKTTLCNRLLADGLGLANSVSMTTRPPRPGERNGIDYRFVSRRRFRDIISRRGFLEYEENFGHLYGTPRAFVENRLKKGRPVLLSVDVKGAMKIRKAYPSASTLIFLLPPSLAALRKRLMARRSDPPDVICRRLGLAKKELSYKKNYDYRIVNDNLEKAYRRLRGVVAAELGKQNKQEGGRKI